MHRSGEKILRQFGFIPSEGYESTNEGKELSENLIYFYRGVSEPPNKTFLIEPSVFRGEDEWDLYHYILQNHSEEFISMLPIEIMAKMQHLGIPTRLLDVTRNPLVSAFFAISDLNEPNLDKKNGHQNKYKDDKSTIIEFKIDQRLIKKFDSDTVKMISHFALLKDDKKKILIKDCMDEIISHAVSQIIFRECECQYLIDTAEQEEQLKFLCYLKKFVFKLISGELLAYENGDDKPVGNEYRNVEIIAKSIKCTNAKESHELVEADKLIFKISVPQGYEMSLRRYEFSISRKEGFNVCPIDFSNMLERLAFDEKCLKKPLSTLFIKYDSSCDKFLSDIKIRELGELDWQIKCSYPQWYNNLERPIDLLNGCFVNPFVNTDRMRVQQGSFMMFGLSRYWNIEECIEFLSDVGCDIDEIYSFIVENKPIFSDDNKCDLFEKYDIDVKEFENFVFNARRYKIRNRKKKDGIIDDLNISGVNKQSLGCSMQTTYFQYRLDKDRSEITKE